MSPIQADPPLPPDLDKFVLQIPQLQSFLERGSRHARFIKSIMEGRQRALKIEERIAVAVKKSQESTLPLILAMEEMADFLGEWDAKLWEMAKIVFKDRVDGKRAWVERELRRRADATPGA